MADDKNRHDAEAAIKACYSTWADTYHADYYAAADAYPPVHQDLVRDLLVKADAKTVLDAGCGPASMLRSLTGMGLDLYGFDLTPQMVIEARRVMEAAGVPAAHIWEGSVADPQAFRAPAGGPALYDAAICIGVLPHVPEALDDAVIANLKAAVKPGGLVVVEARNQFFSLFTLNRYSHQFFMSELIRKDELLAAAGAQRAQLEASLAEVERHFSMDQPPPRGGKAGEPGYDQVLSRTHNPLALAARFTEAGIGDVRTLFYHFHCLPPIVEPGLPILFRERSVAMENPEDWRGYFMASAFVIAGRRP